MMREGIHPETPTPPFLIWLASNGVDPELARYIPLGAIRWRAETDEQGDEDIAPVSSHARAALKPRHCG